MKPLSDFFKRNSVYWGERGHWLVVCVRARDADCLSRSNFRSACRALKGCTDPRGTEYGAKGSQELCDGVHIEEAKHWAVGWIQYLIIDPANTELVKQAEKIHTDLEDYPVFDEDDFSELELEEAETVWRDCYRTSERIEYVRKHRTQFEFRDFADMLNCVRGKYFAGYAGELLN